MKGCPERMFFAVKPNPIFYPVAPGEEPYDLPVQKVEYIRKDLSDARISDLERQLAEAEARGLERALCALKIDPPYGKADGDLMRGREIGYRDAIYDAQQAIRAMKEPTK